jgi:hypothetical protein
MANVLTGRQLFADTVGVLFQTAVKINSIIYSDGIVAGHQANLTDAAGRPVFRGVMGGNLEAEDSGRIGWAQGLTLARIDSGFIIVYIE